MKPTYFDGDSEPRPHTSCKWILGQFAMMLHDFDINFCGPALVQAFKDAAPSRPSICESSFALGDLPSVVCGKLNDVIKADLCVVRC